MPTHELPYQDPSRYLCAFGSANAPFVSLLTDRTRRGMPATDKLGEFGAAQSERAFTGRQALLQDFPTMPMPMLGERKFGNTIIMMMLLAQVVVLRNKPIRVQHHLGCPTEQISGPGPCGGPGSSTKARTECSAKTRDDRERLSRAELLRPLGLWVSQQGRTIRIASLASCHRLSLRYKIRRVERKAGWQQSFERSRRRCSATWSRQHETARLSLRSPRQRCRELLRRKRQQASADGASFFRH